MVQVIQSGPSSATLRQQALQDALNTVTSGLGDYQKQQATKRQQALQDQAIQRQQDAADLDLAFKANTAGIASPVSDLKAFSKGTYQPKEISPAVAATPDQITDAPASTQAMSPADVRMQDESGGIGRAFQQGTAAKDAIMGPANPFHNYTEAKKAQMARDVANAALKQKETESAIAKNNAQADNSSASAKFTREVKPQQIQNQTALVGSRQDLIDSQINRNNSVATGAGNKQETTDIKGINNGLSSMRGDAQAQLAQKALVSTQNAMDLAKKSSWSSQERQLFASEMAKIATGGVPGGHEIQALLPSDLATKYNAAVQFFTSNPGNLTDKEYKQRATEYLTDLRKTNQAYLDARAEKVLRINNYSGLSDAGKSRYRSVPELQTAINKIEGKQMPASIINESTGQPHPQVKQGNTVFNWNPNTNKYEAQ